MRGTKANLLIKQGIDEEYRPTLYIESVANEDIEPFLAKAFNGLLQKEYRGISYEKTGDGLWKVNIPDQIQSGS